MKQHLNTLFVTTDGAYIAKDGQAIAVRIEQETRLRVPIHHLGGIVCFGRVSCSPPAMAACAEAGVAITYMTEHGRFLARVSGFTPGNVLLRRQQYRVADDSDGSADIARSLIAAKIANSRSVVLRAIRDNPHSPHRSTLQATAARLGSCLDDVIDCPNLESLRGLEGDAARSYFDVFSNLITTTEKGFLFNGRSRRPPLDNVNALLSFVYALLTHDTRAACEASGLDPAVGFLHRDRPGRPGLALDLMEELRSFLADRLVLSLINRRQVHPRGFTATESGAVRMDDRTRKTVLTTYQERKQRMITHPFLREKTTVGLIVHLQARLMARYLRNELDAYPAFIWK
ncbi:MAG: type I-C CRISPR-associated endonuclease Cas1 [Planctomycetes bacterium]|nr:type I-C CRISPR-associated endonuclease Cas1 [Planctomycetota bacterium]NOG53191.1 type I-C CRISPR-associated endonuclease Cas1 [Planctomycetota bacterium]